MNAMTMDTSSLRGTALALAIAALTLMTGTAAMADDTDIFFGWSACDNSILKPPKHELACEFVTALVVRHGWAVAEGDLYHDLMV